MRLIDKIASIYSTHESSIPLFCKMRLWRQRMSVIDSTKSRSRFLENFWVIRIFTRYWKPLRLITSTIWNLFVGSKFVERASFFFPSLSSPAVCFAFFVSAILLGRLSAVTASAKVMASSSIFYYLMAYSRGMMGASSYAMFKSFSQVCGSSISFPVFYLNFLRMNSISFFCSSTCFSRAFYIILLNSI